jgi:single-strand DNA-binding protein
MAGMASMTLVGHLGADPEVRFGQDGKAMAKLRVAVSDRRKGKDGAWAEHTQWFGVAVFGKQAEHCGQYLAKGRQVLVMGRLEAREYVAKDGTTKTALEVAADKVQFLGAKDSTDRPPTAEPSLSPARPSGKAAPTSTQSTDDWENEELPF